MAALIIELVINVAHGSVDYEPRKQRIAFYLHSKINKKASSREGFEPTTLSVTGEHATH
jgi:hypothetical protein